MPPGPVESLRTSVRRATESPPVESEGTELAGLDCLLCSALSKLPVTKTDQVTWAGRRVPWQFAVSGLSVLSRCRVFTGPEKTKARVARGEK